MSGLRIRLPRPRAQHQPQRNQVRLALSLLAYNLGNLWHLERIIEKAGDVEASAAAVVSAVAAYAKINANGQWVDRSESVNLNELFERMSREEMEAYAKEGVLPAWFEQAVGATDTNSRGGSK